MTYDEFVREFCGDRPPSAGQREAIEAVLAVAMLETGELRGQGRSTLRQWVRGYLVHQERLERQRVRPGGPGDVRPGPGPRRPRRRAPRQVPS